MKQIPHTLQIKLLTLLTLSGFMALTWVMSVTNPGSVLGFPITPPTTNPINPSPSPMLPITGPINPSPTPTVTPTPTLVPSPTPTPTLMPSPSPSLLPTSTPTPTPTPPVVNIAVPKLKTQALPTGKQAKSYQAKVVITAPKNVNFSVYTLGLPHGLVQSQITYKKTANKQIKATFYISGISRQSGNFNVMFYMTGKFGTVSESRLLIIKPNSKKIVPIKQKPGFGRYL